MTASALAATGGLTPSGCIADPAHNPDGCAKTAAGLDGAVRAAVSADGKSVYATGGSDNAIVTFKRNTITGALTPTGCIADPKHNPDSCTKTAGGLDGPAGVAVSADGKSVYATSFLDNAIVTFERNTTTGALTPTGCIADPGHNPDGCARTAAGLDGPAGVAVSADGKSVYVGGGVDNAIVAFKRNTITGALTPSGCIADPAHNPDGCAKTAAGLEDAAGVVVSADGKSVYAMGSLDNAIVAFKRNTITGALRPSGCIADPEFNPDGCAKTAAGLDGAVSPAVSADGKSVYATGKGDNAIVAFKRNTTTGALTPTGCIADPTHNPDSCIEAARGLDGAEQVAVSADGKSVYVAGDFDNAIVTFARNTTTGALASTGCIADPAHNPDGCAKTAAGLDGAVSPALSADGKSVYATGKIDNAIVAFRRNTTTGALTPTGCIADPTHNPDSCIGAARGLDGAEQVAVSADGKSVYVAGGFDNSIVTFARRTTTGALTPTGCIADPKHNPDSCTKTSRGLDGSIGVAVSGDGRSVYATGHNDNAIVAFRRAP